MSNRPYGVLGKTLQHSYTPEIYKQLANIDYRKFEIEETELKSFLLSEEWEGINVTIPYKKTVMSYLDSFGEEVKRLGNVNTIIRDTHGHLIGHNTDYFGFKILVESLGTSVQGKKALVFGGNGGAGSTCMCVLKDLGVRAYSVNLTGDLTYENMLDFHRDAQLIVNATPVGMYPNCPAAVASLKSFKQLEGVVDIVYNPARTALMMEAEQLGITCAGGLLMLVAQAAKAIEYYNGFMPSMKEILETTSKLSNQVKNIALIGMPGSGKTTIGEELARISNRKFIDLDAFIEEKVDQSCSSYIKEKGEEAFRLIESTTLKEISSQSNLVIACGGGIVTQPVNYEYLHQNSRIVYIKRPLNKLSTNDRPLSKTLGVKSLYAQRKDLYESWADFSLPVSNYSTKTALSIKTKLNL